MPDFFEQVLGNIESYEPRFASDLKRMNNFVAALDLVEEPGVAAAE